MKFFISFMNCIVTFDHINLITKNATNWTWLVCSEHRVIAPLSLALSPHSKEIFILNFRCHLRTAVVYASFTIPLVHWWSSVTFKIRRPYNNCPVMAKIESINWSRNPIHLAMYKNWRYPDHKISRSITRPNEEVWSINTWNEEKFEVTWSKKVKM